MSTFSEVIGAQQAQAQEPRNQQDQQMRIQQFIADRQAAQQQMRMAQEDRDRAMMQQRQTDQAAALDKSNQNAGLNAYVSFLKERGNIAPNGAPAMVGPNVSQRQMVGQNQPQMQPLTFDYVSQALLRKNPNMSPQVFMKAMEQFAPQFDRNDQMALEKFKAEARGQYAGFDIENAAYKEAKARGLSEFDAIEAAKQAKRAGATEAGQVQSAKERAKLEAGGKISEKEEAAKGQKQIGGIVGELSGLHDQLDQMGGAVNSDKSAAQNIGAYAANTAVGQMVGGALGTKSQGLRDQIAQSRPLLINAIRKATGMGAKAMDSNTELQFYLSAATDPTRGIQANRAALERLNQLYGLDGSQSANQGQQRNNDPLGLFQ